MTTEIETIEATAEKLPKTEEPPKTEEWFILVIRCSDGLWATLGMSTSLRNIKTALRNLEPTKYKIIRVTLPMGE